MNHPDKKKIPIQVQIAFLFSEETIVKYLSEAQGKIVPCFLYFRGGIK